MTSTRYYLELSKEKGDRFWELEVLGNQHRLRYGLVGKPGTERTKLFESDQQAREAVERLVVQKRKQGYAEPNAESHPMLMNESEAEPAPPHPSAPTEPSQEPSDPSQDLDDADSGIFDDDPEGLAALIDFVCTDDDDDDEFEEDVDDGPVGEDPQPRA